jgi:hypothetical protein
MTAQYVVTLITEERDELASVTRSRKTILGQLSSPGTCLLSEPEPEVPGWNIPDICEALNITPSQIDKAQKAFF